MYDKSNSGIHLRKYVHASLALWHNYKWASAKLLQVFGRDFIAPLFHQIFPDRSIDISSMFTFNDIHVTIVYATIVPIIS